MHTIAEKKAKKDKKPTRELRAGEEGEGDGGGDDDHNGDEDNNSEDEKARMAFTQEHIAQMFEGELDEFASLTSHGVSSNQRQQQRSTGGGNTRIQYLIENEISGDFFRVKSNSINISTTQRRKPLLFASSMGASASRFSASLHFGKLEAAGGDDSTWAAQAEEKTADS